MKKNGQTANSAENVFRLWRFGECEFDELRYELRVRGKPVEIERKPLDVLLQLLRAGRVVRKEELFDSVWPGLLVVDASLATAVSKLRKVLDEQDVIQTVPKVGYRISVEVRCIEDANKVPQRAAEEEPPLPLSRNRCVRNSETRLRSKPPCVDQLSGGPLEARSFLYSRSL